MKYFLRWVQVQQRLAEHFQATGAPCSFFEAARELWEEGQFQSGEKLPAVSFLDWDCADLTQLEALLNQIPMDLGNFHQDFASGDEARSASAEHINDLNIAPFRIARYQAEGAHVHKSFEIDYVVRGTARLICGENVRILPEGALCLISPDFFHDAVADDDCILLSVVLSEQNVENTLFRLLQKESLVSDFFRVGLRDSRYGYILFSDLDSSVTLPLFRGLLHEFYSGEEYFRDACAGYLELLLIHLLRQTGRCCEQATSGAFARRGGFLMLSILKYIQLHYKTATLNETAAIFHYEPGYLGKLIKRHTGKSYVQIIHDLRLDEAKRLLRDTDMSVTKVAASSGFHSVVHFSRTFHKGVGMTPGEWREMAAKPKDGKC